MDKLIFTDSRTKVFAYAGKLNPYDVPLTIGEIALSVADVNGKYQPRGVILEVFERLSAYEDTKLTPEEITALIAERDTLKKALEKLIFAIEAEHGDNGIHTEHSIAVNMAVKQAQEGQK